MYGGPPAVMTTSEHGAGCHGAPVAFSEPHFHRMASHQQAMPPHSMPTGHHLQQGGPSGHVAPQPPLTPLQQMMIELQLRGNLLMMQRRRIMDLEQRLAQAYHEIRRLSGPTPAADEAGRATGRSGSQKDERKQKKNSSRYWSPEEHALFLEALQKFGPKEVRRISAFVGTRTPIQVRTHTQKFYLKIQREELQSKGGSKSSKRRRGRMELPEDLSSIPRPNKLAHLESADDVSEVSSQLTTQGGVTEAATSSPSSKPCAQRSDTETSAATTGASAPTTDPDELTE